MRASGRSVANFDSRRFEKELQRHPVAILPVGALEAHGPHLPLAADQIQAERTAEALAERVDGVVLPTVPYGVCRAARRFPGTVSLELGTLSELVRNLVSETGRWGVRRLLILSGHAESPHMAALREGAEAAQRAPSAIAVVSDYDFVYELRGSLAPPTDGHAGRLETSRLLALAPETVSSVRPSHVQRKSRYRLGDLTIEEWSESVVGDPTEASAEIGRQVQAHVLQRLEQLVGTELAA